MEGCYCNKLQSWLEILAHALKGWSVVVEGHSTIFQELLTYVGREELNLLEEKEILQELNVLFKKSHLGKKVMNHRQNLKHKDKPI